MNETFVVVVVLRKKKCHLSKFWFIFISKHNNHHYSRECGYTKNTHTHTPKWNFHFKKWIQSIFCYEKTLFFFKVYLHKIRITMKRNEKKAKMKSYVKKICIFFLLSKFEILVYFFQMLYEKIIIWLSCL